MENSDEDHDPCRRCRLEPGRRRCVCSGRTGWLPGASLWRASQRLIWLRLHDRGRGQYPRPFAIPDVLDMFATVGYRLVMPDTPHLRTATSNEIADALSDGHPLHTRQLPSISALPRTLPAVHPANRARGMILPHNRRERPRTVPRPAGAARIARVQQLEMLRLRPIAW
jgi:hypothetical protein